jgi:leader peptidase (prepilin peptidase)/N-methyltransferase
MSSVEAANEVRGAAVGRLAVPPGVVAVVSIALAAGAFIKFEDLDRALVAAAFCAVLPVVATVDLERRIIPNRIVVPAGLLVLLGDIAAEPGRAAEWTIAAFATLAGGVLLSLAARGGIGLGDAKLGFLLGAGLGWTVVGGLVLASIGLFVAALVTLAARGLGARKDALPFGPFLALGAIVMLFLS